MTDYKQLCIELINELNGYKVAHPQHDTELIDRARAALAQPKPLKERPNRLRVGDMWEFWTEVPVKGKKKPVEKLLQWEVVGWHNGQYAWELVSLDGEHKEYLLEFAPTYEDMRFLGSKIND